MKEKKKIWIKYSVNIDIFQTNEAVSKWILNIFKLFAFVILSLDAIHCCNAAINNHLLDCINISTRVRHSKLYILLLLLASSFFLHRQPCDKLSARDDALAAGTASSTAFGNAMRIRWPSHSPRLTARLLASRWGGTYPVPTRVGYI